MHMATMFLLIVSAGLASQWLAAQVRLPAIVVLIAVGLVLGPLTGTISLSLPAAELTEMIGLGVAIILFEGGMDLKTSEFRREKHGIRRLTLLAPPIAWLLGAAAAHYLVGLSWPVSWVGNRPFGISTYSSTVSSSVARATNKVAPWWRSTHTSQRS